MGACPICGQLRSEHSTAVAKGNSKQVVVDARTSEECDKSSFCLPTLGRQVKGREFGSRIKLTLMSK